MKVFQKKKANPKTDTEDNAVKEIMGLLLYILAVIALILVIHMYIGERTDVAGDSMNTTLQDGDSLWLSKISYRFADPERFDIVVFPYMDTVTGKEVLLVKRIIGLPNETIAIDDNGNILVNGEVLQEEYGNARIDSYHIGIADKPITLGEEEYFVMGDNRNDSKDSRDASVGAVSRDSIMGKVVFRMWPWKSIGTVK